MTVLFLDCFSGVAGDMLLGALLDAGAPLQDVTQSVDALGIPGWSLRVEEVRRAGIRATRAEVDVEDSGEARPYGRVKRLLEDAPLDEQVRERSLRTFEHLARAEARVHGIDPDDVHFHEVGGTDALIDVVGVAAALEHFSPVSIVCSPIATGTGTVEAEHGKLPLPAPAVAELLVGAPLVGKGRRELVTPTGAALVVASGARFGPLPAMTLSATGYGAGAADLEYPNVMRVLVGSETGNPAIRSAVLVETNIDDLAPEAVSYVIARLLAAGARDAWATTIVMKKGRPGVTLSVLTEPADLDPLLDILYSETTTLGARISSMERDELERSVVEVEVSGEPVAVKIGRRRGHIVTRSPEFEDVRRVAEKTGAPFKDVYVRAQRAAEEADGGRA